MLVIFNMKVIYVNITVYYLHELILFAEKPLIGFDQTGKGRRSSPPNSSVSRHCTLSNTSVKGYLSVSHDN